MDIYHQKPAGHSSLRFESSGLRPRMGPRTTAGWRSGSGSFFFVVFLVLADYARLYGKRRMSLGRDCARRAMRRCAVGAFVRSFARSFVRSFVIP